MSVGIHIYMVVCAVSKTIIHCIQVYIMQIVLRMTTFSIYQHLTQVSRHPYMVRPIIQYKTGKKNFSNRTLNSVQLSLMKCLQKYGNTCKLLQLSMPIPATMTANPRRVHSVWVSMDEWTGLHVRIDSTVWVSMPARMTINIKIQGMQCLGVHGCGGMDCTYTFILYLSGCPCQPG